MLIAAQLYRESKLKGEVYFQNSSVRIGSENNCLFSGPVLKITVYFVSILDLHENQERSMKS